MKKSKLPPREREICGRIRRAREVLELTQESCARQIGIEKATLANYEYERSPVRAEVALRFCRNLVISEEWLATGEFEATARAGKKRKIDLQNRDRLFQLVLLRHTVDLLSDPIRNRLPTNALYSEAWDSLLAVRFGELIEKHFFRPRLIGSDRYEHQVVLNLLNAYIFRYSAMLTNEANRLKVDPGSVGGQFMRALLETGDVIFKRFMGFNTPEVQTESRFDYLRIIVASPSAPIGPLHTKEPAPSEES